MTTKEVADKLVQLCRDNDYEGAYAMYADDAKSVEMPGMPQEVTQGRDAIIKSYQDWAENIEEVHGGVVEDPIVGDNHFALRMTMDATFKDVGRQQIDEICVYEVENDRIKSARFFYQVPEMGPTM